MVVCPVALAVGCKKCPIVNVCPVRSVIGDYGKRDADAPAPKTQAQAQAKVKETGRRSKTRHKS